MDRQSYRPEVPPKDPPKGNRPAKQREAAGNTAGHRQVRKPVGQGGNFKETGKGKGKPFAERAADQAVGKPQAVGQVIPNRQYHYEGKKLSPKCMDTDERQQYEARKQQQRLRHHRQQQEQVQLHYPNGLSTTGNARSRLATYRNNDRLRRPSDTLIDNVTGTVQRWKHARAEEQHTRKHEQLKSKISSPILVNGMITPSGEKRQRERDQFWNEDKRWVKMMVRAGKLEREADGSIRPPMQAPTAGKTSAGKKSHMLTFERSFSFEKVAGAFRRRLGSRGEEGHGADEKRKHVKPLKDQLQIRPETAAAAASHSRWPETHANGFSSSNTGNHQVKDRVTRLGDFMVSPFLDKFKGFQGGRDRRDSDSTFFCAGVNEVQANAAVAAGLHHLESPPPHIPQVTPLYNLERPEPVKPKRRSTFSHISRVEVTKNRETALEALTSGDLEGQFQGFEGYHYDNGDDESHHLDDASHHYNFNDNTNREGGHEGQSGKMTVSRAYDFVSGNLAGCHLANADDVDLHHGDSDPFEYEYLSQEFIDNFMESSLREHQPLPSSKARSTPRISPVSSISPLTVEGILAGGEEQGEQLPHYQSRKPTKHSRNRKKLELALDRDDSQTLPSSEEHFGQRGKYKLPVGAVAAEHNKNYNHDEGLDYKNLCAPRYHPGRNGDDYTDSPWTMPLQQDVRVRSPRCVIEPSDRYKSWYVDLEEHR